MHKAQRQAQPSTVLYDVTNFFFEIGEANEDVEMEVVGQDGEKSTEAVRELRKFGVRKEGWRHSSQASRRSEM